MSGLHLGRIVAAWQRPLTSRPVTGAAPTPRDPVPVTLGGTRVTQVDGTTCGAAVLLMLRASGDETLAAELDANPGMIDSYQREIHADVCRGALGPLSWPRAYGSPPWSLAREARYPGVDYEARAVDDASEHGRAILNAVWHANRHGIPVPLYTGGNLREGLSRAVPRHVVLAVPPAEPVSEASLLIYEPSSGLLHEVPLTDLFARTGPHPALGGWTHIVWAILPRPKAH